MAFDFFQFLCEAQFMIFIIITLIAIEMFSKYVKTLYESDLCSELSTQLNGQIFKLTYFTYFKLTGKYSV